MSPKKVLTSLLALVVVLSALVPISTAHNTNIDDSEEENGQVSRRSPYVAASVLAVFSSTIAAVGYAVGYVQDIVHSDVMFSDQLDTSILTLYTKRTLIVSQFPSNNLYCIESLLAWQEAERIVTLFDQDVLELLQKLKARQETRAESWISYVSGNDQAQRWKNQTDRIGHLFIRETLEERVRMKTCIPDPEPQIEVEEQVQQDVWDCVLSWRCELLMMANLFCFVYIRLVMYPVFAGLYDDRKQKAEDNTPRLDHGRNG